MKKRFALSLALMAGLVMGATAADAASIKATGKWQVDAVFADKNYFEGNGTGNNKTVSIDQRIRTAFQFIANENLKGVFEVQAGTESWGHGGFQVGQKGGADSNNIELRKAYIDFNWPGTKNRFLVGHQSLSLPSAFGGGSAILDEHMSAAAAIIPINDNISIVGGYARLTDADGSDRVPGNNLEGTSTDAAFVYTDLKFDGFNVQPFFAYGYSGANSMGTTGTGLTNSLEGFRAPGVGTNEGVRAYWGGAAFTMTALDPFKVTADVNYGKATFNNGTDTDSGRAGWLADIAVDYTGLSMMTPSVFFAYSSGEDSTAGKSERMPVVMAENWAIGSFWMQGGDTIGTSYVTPGSALGFWAAGLQLKDIKFIDKLSHTFNVIYFKGTNAEENVGRAGFGSYGTVLTEKDSLWEVDLNSKYQIYEELSLGLELGYIFANFDKDVWATSGNRDSLDQDAYKAAFMLNYSF